MEKDNDSLLRKEYICRINIVQDYIEKHMDKTFTLDELAEISGFSKYHFHRVFAGIVNETLYNYILRQRLEKAVSFLVHTPHKSITEIALDFGFGDSAIFARSFKKIYGMSATKYRQANSNNSKAESRLTIYNHAENINYWRQKKMETKHKIEVLDISEMNVVYLRHAGTYEQLGKVFHKMIEKLYAWGMQHSLIIPNKTKLIAIYHDDPGITEDGKRRTSLCITVPKETKSEGEFGKMDIAEGKYAVGHFEIEDSVAAKQHSDAWSYMFGDWLPDSGYQPDDNPVFEVYVNDPNMHPERKHLVDIYLPIKKL